MPTINLSFEILTKAIFPYYKLFFHFFPSMSSPEIWQQVKIEFRLILYLPY